MAEELRMAKDALSTYKEQLEATNEGRGHEQQDWAQRCVC